MAIEIVDLPFFFAKMVMNSKQQSVSLAAPPWWMNRWRVCHKHTMVIILWMVANSCATLDLSTGTVQDVHLDATSQCANLLLCTGYTLAGSCRYFHVFPVISHICHDPPRFPHVFPVKIPSEFPVETRHDSAIQPSPPGTSRPPDLDMVLQLCSDERSLVEAHGGGSHPMP